MPFERPTLPELRERIRRDFSARLPGADALLRQSNLRVVADVLAQLSTLHYGYQEWLSLQLFPDTAEATFLDRWADIWGVSREPATVAFGNVTVTGLADATVPATTEWQRTDRVRYVTQVGGVLDATGTGTIAVVAVDAGLTGNADAGTELQMVTAFPGVYPQAVVAAPGIAGGTDLETDERLRVRLMARIQFPPEGGAAQDYVAWAMEVPGVTRAWCYPLERGAGSVVVRFMMDDVRAPTGIPTPADVAIVQAHIDLLRPVTAQVYVLAPIPRPVNVTIATLTPDTPDVRAAVQAQLTQALFRNAVPGGTIYVSWLWEAVSIASGERHHRLVAPPADVPMGTGELAQLGTVTYVP